MALPSDATVGIKNFVCLPDFPSYDDYIEPYLLIRSSGQGGYD